jgi:hypothetical protein
MNAYRKKGRVVSKLAFKKAGNVVLTMEIQKIAYLFPLLGRYYPQVHR